MSKPLIPTDAVPSTFEDDHSEVNQNINARRSRCLTLTSIWFMMGTFGLLVAACASVWCQGKLKSGFDVDMYLWYRSVQTKHVDYGDNANRVYGIIASVIVTMVLGVLILAVQIVRLRSRPDLTCTQHFQDQYGNLDRSATRCCGWRSAGWRLTWGGLFYGYYLNLLLGLYVCIVFSVALAWVPISIKSLDDYVWSSVNFSQHGFLAYCASALVVAFLVSFESGFQSLLFLQAGYMRAHQQYSRQVSKRSGAVTLYGTMSADFTQTYKTQPSVKLANGYEDAVVRP